MTGSSPLVSRSALIGSLVALLVAAHLVAAAKGVWFDELFSVYEAQHRAPFAEMFWRHWMVDGHPPLFNLFNWTLEPLVGDDIEARRALNLVPLALAAAAIATIARQYSESRSFLFVYALLLLASPVALEQIVEHRANFGQFSAMSVAVAIFVTIGLAGRDREAADRPMAIMLFAALLISFNLHYIGALSAGFVSGVFIVVNWVAARRRWALTIFFLAAVAAVPLVASLAAQSLLLTSYTRDFWIATDSKSAAKTIADLFLGAAKANLVATAVAVIGCAHAVRQRDSAIGQTKLESALSCLIAACLVCAILFVVNIYRPIILLRYLVTEVPLIIAAIAVLAADMTVKRWWLVAATAVAGVATLALFGQRLSQQANWSASARIVADVVRRCPTAAVHAPLQWSASFTVDGPDYAPVMRYGYEVVGRRFSFAVEPERSRRVDGKCPTLVWVEHYHERVPSAAEAVSGLAIGPQAIAAATIRRTQSGFVVNYPPAPGGTNARR